ncbi:uncharacterized protein LOC131433794 [Malaya genurostris]|uniref:uncharacterized protein LOC131433794 n=1 Tax=Malaya genurostris TaxID=325434 RepID=UPI0026F38A8F|nr:uncharacterized protein LOC131433794 [Malaya genurostris]
MADLPPARLAAFTRPFSFVGIDYFGPFTVSIGRRSEKRWGVLVTCLTVRAVHLEVAHSLTTSSCIIALRNFMARRGVPIEIYSDQGTNFKGASKELQIAYRNIDHDQVMREFISPRTRWVFIPPVSPHMGGCWERLVQSVKRNLSHVMENKRLTDEVLHNALVEIENIINSRPLTHVPMLDDGVTLTPNHLLLGSSSGCKPLVEFDDSAKGVIHGWKISQVCANEFWKHWIKAYLPEITRRAKWFTKTKPIAVGDVVIVVDPNLPRNCWPKGRIIDAKIADDGQVRSATVQTVHGIYERPAVKLAVLDIGTKDCNPLIEDRLTRGECCDSSQSPSSIHSVCHTISDGNTQVAN